MCDAKSEMEALLRGCDKEDQARLGRQIVSLLVRLVARIHQISKPGRFADKCPLWGGFEALAVMRGA